MQSNILEKKCSFPVATTCTDITVLGSNAVSLTTTQIESLTTSEFTDCTETLGAITGWSSTQMSSLATEAKAVSDLYFFY